MKDFLMGNENRRLALIFFCSTLGVWGLSLLQYKEVTGLPWWMFTLIALLVGLVPFVMLVYKDYQQELKELDQTQQDMQKSIDPNIMYERMGADPISLLVGSGLLEIVDPEQGGQVLGKLAGLRKALTDELGYILPNVRVLDSITLEPYQYELLIRGSSVAKGFVYPERLRVLASDFDKLGELLPETVIVGVDPISNATVYWLSHSDIKPEWQLKTSDATDTVIAHLRTIVIQYVDYVVSNMDVLKLMELVRQSDPFLVNELVPHLLSSIDLRRIFTNLIREQVSIKDIVFIFERLNDYARFYQNTDELTQCVRNALGLQICKNLLGNNETLLAVKLSTQWENRLEEAYQYSKALGSTFNLTDEEEAALIKSTDACLQLAQQQHGRVPVILCSPRIRLPLYQLLDRHLPMITVLSYSELIPDVKVQAVDSINMPEGA